jgi:hypothetical protein
MYLTGIKLLSMVPIAIWGDITAAAKEVVTSGK